MSLAVYSFLTERRRARELALLLLALLACVQGFRAFRDYVFEDAYITYRYAENLAAGRGFTFNPDERVFGTTTPLYTLVLAGAGALGFDIPTAGALLSAACIAATALAGASILRRCAHPELGLVYALAVLWGAGGTYFLSGMETSFLCLLLHLAWLAAWSRRPLFLGLWLGLACLTRYDAVLFAAPLLGLVWWREQRPPWRSALVAAGLVLPWLVFATLYFGSPLPNTLAAKGGYLSFGAYLASSGSLLARDLCCPLLALHIERLSRAYPLVALALFLAPLPLLFARAGRREPLVLQLALYPPLLWLGYACIGPGPCSWHLVPAGLFLLLAGLHAWGELAESRRLESSRWPATISLGASLVLLPPLFSLYSANARELPSYRQRAEGYTELARWMAERRLDDLRVFIEEPGYFAYRSHCAVVDGHGLVTRGQLRGTALAERVDPHRVEALVGVHALAGYVPVRESPRFLALRRDVYEARLDTLASDWLAPPPAPPAAPGHPLRLDFDGALTGWQGALDFTTVDAVTPQGEERSLTTAVEVTGEPRPRLESPPFTLDFDELRFAFGTRPVRGRLKSLSCSLVVNGLPVLSVDEHDVRPGESIDVRWPVHAWRGRTAWLRFDDLAMRGWLVADDVRSLRHRDVVPFDDFEGETYDARWRTTFGPAPVEWRCIAEHLGLACVQGRASALSLFQGGAQALVSRPFVLARGRLAGVVFDFGGERTRVELAVDGRVVRSFTGRDSHTLRALLFDVAAFRGREAVLSVLDDDPRAEAGIGVDALVLYDE